MKLKLIKFAALYLIFSLPIIAAPPAYYEIFGHSKVEEKTDIIEDIEVREPTALITAKVDKSKLGFAGDLNLTPPPVSFLSKGQPDNFIIYDDLYNIAKRYQKPFINEKSKIKDMIFMIFMNP